MALGNNLKGIRKDSLIPDKKEKLKKGKSKTDTPPKVKVVSKSKVKSPAKGKPKASTKPKAKPVKKELGSKSKAAKPKTVTKKTDKPGQKKSRKVTNVAKPIETVHLNESVLLGGEDGGPITAKLVPSRRKTVRKTKLIFEGSLSLMEAEAIKDCLLTTFTDYDIIDIQLSNITHIDIIPIQLINIFIGHFPDKKVKIDSDLPFDMKIVVERAGFGPLMFKEEAA